MTTTAPLSREVLGLEHEIVDAATLQRTAGRFREAGVALPTFAQLADPSLAPSGIHKALAGIGPDEAHPLNLFRVHWYNDASRTGTVAVPQHLVLPSELTGVEATIVVALGDRFPMIGAHKVLAAYGCLAPRVVTGRFDPTTHRAIWPSTGNYCRGGVAISRLMGCHGVAVLPEGMSQERFDWLDGWVVTPDDIIRTPGTESNVKEIYDRCNELALDPENFIFNQFAEFGNHIVHYAATGSALARVFEAMQEVQPELRLRAFVSATGSAGTIGAGDYLKEQYGALIVACEALECPTMLRNGFGEHNIQGIGDKHIPLIHNVFNTDVALAVPDRATDSLGLLFGSEAGRAYLAGRRSVPVPIVEGLDSLGLSSICNVLGAIKTAKYYGMGPEDVIVTVATDGAAMYGSERELARAKYFRDGFDDVSAGEVFSEHMLGAGTDNLLELSHVERDRIFNLGYYTWVEQQGISIEEFQARRSQRFWHEIRNVVSSWDELIGELNDRSRVLEMM